MSWLSSEFLCTFSTSSYFFYTRPGLQHNFCSGILLCHFLYLKVDAISVLVLNIGFESSPIVDIDGAFDFWFPLLVS